MKFVDEAEISVTAGSGGDGCVAFRREKFVPRGGPSGGDGGNGGHIFVEATTRLTTLLDFRYRPHIRADRGEHGRGKDQYGHGGEHQTIRVPVGTLVRDADTGETLADLKQDGQRVSVAKGGK
ncbi:MAG TPA: GTPase ObgE, partial [Deltaproteobacteria bacterium]|nr:GTPase ObgE [Deltaproteobacteria bacterium]